MAPAVKSSPGRQSIQSIPAGLVGLGAALLVFMASRGLGALGSRDEPPAPPVCDTWHRGGGESQPVDFERVRRGYVELKDRLSASLKHSMEKELGSIGRQGYDLGLRAGTRVDTRR